MKAIDFEGRNVIVAEHQPPYAPLPAHIAPNGRLTACWQLTWGERIRIFFTGKLWHQVLTFKHPLQPQKLTLDKPILKNYEI
jgi:hypothetical protein